MAYIVSTQPSLLRRRLRRHRPRHRQGTPTVASCRTHDRADAEAIAASLIDARPPAHRPRSDGRHHARRVPHRQWLPRSVATRPGHDRLPLRLDDRPLHHTRLGDIRCDRSAPSTSTTCTPTCSTTAAHDGAGLAPKTVHEVHVIVRAPSTTPRCRLDPHQRRDRSTTTAIASAAPHAARPRGPPTELAEFLDAARRTCALPDAAPRRHDRDATRRDRRAPLGRLEPPPTSALDQPHTPSASPAAPPSSPPRPAPADAASTSTPPPRQILDAWRHANSRTGSPPAPMTRCSPTPPAGRCTPNRSASSSTASSPASGLPRIRFHDLRHTHASLLVAAGVTDQGRVRTPRSCPPGFTMPPTNTCSPA